MPSIRDLSYITDSKEVKHGALSSEQCSIYIDIGNPTKTSITASLKLRTTRSTYKRLDQPINDSIKRLTVAYPLELPCSNYTKPVRQYSITGVGYRIAIVLILAPPSRFLVPRNHLSFILLRRTKRSSVPLVRRRELASKLTEVTMRPCEHCIRGHKQCLVGANSDRCSNCVSTGRKYDLVVSPIEIRCIENERKDLWL